MEEPLEHPPEVREGDNSVARTDDGHDGAEESELEDAPELDDDDLEDDDVADA